MGPEKKSFRPIQPGKRVRGNKGYVAEALTSIAGGRYVEREDTIAKVWLDPIRLESEGFSRLEVRKIQRLASAYVVSLSQNSDVIPAERGGARESRNPGNTRTLHSRLRGNDENGPWILSMHF